MTWWERYESVVDQRIREAQEAGAFDDLPGAGKPLKGLHGPDDPHWWVRSYLEREGLPTDGLLPPPLRLRKEVERLPETVRDLDDEADVRAAVRDVNRRVAAFVRNPSGPRIVVRPASMDDVVAGWRAGRSRRGAGTARGPEPVAPDDGALGGAPDDVGGGERRRARRRWFRRRGS